MSFRGIDFLNVSLLASETRGFRGPGWLELFSRQNNRFPLALTEKTASDYELRDPDVRLMLQVRDDSASAFEELVIRYQTRLVTILEHLVGNREAAEDLAQEVFLRVYRARKRYVPGAKFSTWLFTIANNVANNQLRTLSRRREVTLGNRNDSDAHLRMESLATAGSGTMPSRQMDKVERAEIVRLAIDALGERQRMALLLAKFENMSYAEIAESMNLTTKAVKSLLSRARCNLRDQLAAYMQDGSSPLAKPDSADASPSPSSPSPSRSS